MSAPDLMVNGPQPFTRQPIDAIITPLDSEVLVRPLREMTGPLAASKAAPELPLFWVGAQAPDAPHAGLALHRVDALESLDASLRAHAAGPGVVVVALEQVATPLWRQLCGGAGMKPLLKMVLADCPTEDDMCRAIDAGVHEVVPAACAQAWVPTVVERFVQASGLPAGASLALRPAIDAATAMQNMQADEAFFSELLRAFIDEIPQRRAALRNAWPLQPQSVARQCHSVKGVARTLGLDGLARVAAEWETLATQARDGGGGALTEVRRVRLDGELQSAHFQMLRWLHAGAAPTGR